METVILRAAGEREEGRQTERFNGADRERGGQTERLDEAGSRFLQFCKGAGHLIFPYSREISKSVTSTRKVKGTKLKITVSFNTSFQKICKVVFCISSVFRDAGAWTFSYFKPFLGAFMEVSEYRVPLLVCLQGAIFGMFTGCHCWYVYRVPLLVCLQGAIVAVLVLKFLA
jgi:hypothetical protein